MKVVCFHNPNEENGYLSNWYLSKFIVDDITYSSMEQYMMYQKAICFNDIEISVKILSTDDAHAVRELTYKGAGKRLPSIALEIGSLLTVFPSKYSSETSK